MSEAIEFVEEVEAESGEEADLYRLTEPTDVQVGEAVPGVPVVARDVEYIVAVEAHLDAEDIVSMMGDTSEMSDEEIEQMAVGMTGGTEINEAGVSISNETGDPGPVVVQESDVDRDTVLEQFVDGYLSD